MLSSVLQVLAAVVRNPRLRSVTNLLISNMAATDILFCLGIPVIATTRITQHWVLGGFVCKTVTYLQFTAGICSILTMTTISLERYMCVCLLNRWKLSLKQLIFSIVCIWFVAIGFPVPVALAQSMVTVQTGNESFTFCGVSWREEFHTEIYLGFMAGLFFVIPLTAISVFYLRILRVVNSSIDRTKTSRQSSAKSGARKQIRLIKMCSSIVFLFVIMWLPFFIISFLGVHLKQITSTHFTATLILALANTCCNPILYGYFNDRLREEFKQMCFVSFLKQKHQTSRNSAYGVQTEHGSVGVGGNSSTV